MSVKDPPHNIRMGGGITAQINKVGGLIKKHGLMGRAISYTGQKKGWKVYLDKNMPLKDYANTLSHESIHLADTKHKLGLSESQVESVTNTLMDGLRKYSHWSSIKNYLQDHNSGITNRQLSGIIASYKAILEKNPRYRRLIRRYASGESK